MFCDPTEKFCDVLYDSTANFAGGHTETPAISSNFLPASTARQQRNVPCRPSARAAFPAREMTRLRTVIFQQEAGWTYAARQCVCPACLLLEDHHAQPRRQGLDAEQPTRLPVHFITHMPMQLQLLAASPSHGLCINTFTVLSLLCKRSSD
jgi:hypothetical protein